SVSSLYDAGVPMAWGSSAMVEDLRWASRRLLGEVIPREGRAHIGSREEQLDDDLDGGVAAEPAAADGGAGGLAPIAADLHEEIGGAVDHPRLIVEAGGRSEERRVGRECRWRWAWWMVQQMEAVRRE